MDSCGPLWLQGRCSRQLWTPKEIETQHRACRLTTSTGQLILSYAGYLPSEQKRWATSTGRFPLWGMQIDHSIGLPWVSSMLKTWTYLVTEKRERKVTSHICVYSVEERDAFHICEGSRFPLLLGQFFPGKQLNPIFGDGIHEFRNCFTL